MFCKGAVEHNRCLTGALIKILFVTWAYCSSQAFFCTSPALHDVIGCSTKREVVCLLKTRGLHGVRGVLYFRGDFEGVTDPQVEEIEAVEKGLLQEAQRFFLLTQTDNMWKEHLQVSMAALSEAVTPAAGQHNCTLR